MNETGGLYCGTSLTWNYAKSYVDIAMPGCVKKQLTRYAYSPSPHRRYLLYDPSQVVTGKAAQNLPPEDSYKPLDAVEKKRTQQVVEFLV